MPLILASSSRYRAELLSRLHVPFTTQSPDVDESPRPGETPHELALRLSVDKARKVAQQHPGSLVIGADQVATVNGEAIGKPGTHEKAVAQLRHLSGQTVLFHSALCVHDGQRFEAQDVITRCIFRELSDQEIETYLSLDLPYDTAGSAKAESLGISLMDAMHSDDPTAIIGLPLIALSRMLRSFGVNPLAASLTEGCAT
ncbi:septum formation protein Maf [Pusillimonas sp. CC-YST705]|uniref:7-methyl-GTP pyrophosphatase n=1 Tax=Mesopusillimonas faecipullorum TaxID=2755040 RepID=A0ABS8C8U3_9BURK|nr:Maf family nucleotide pyrophosphatase [Mesopusillimonas faecipullorum]MCB5362446.1 septum formation protein Maf [Mesopusillimonas faecipullorum]